MCTGGPVRNLKGDRIFSGGIFDGWRIACTVRQSVTKVPGIDELLSVKIITLLSGQINTAFIHPQA
jgi:hypothetical protein